jgi:hypothetical protein
MKILLALGLLTSSVLASDINVDTFSTSLDFAQIKSVKAVQSSDGSWCFHTAVRHNDEGWEHYADGWQVIDFKGNELGARPLAHPHENEQPFTRSQCNIHIPKELTKVIVRAKCNKHGFGGQPVTVDLTALKGTGFSVKRGL